MYKAVSDLCWPSVVEMPFTNLLSSGMEEEPMSRTSQYRKVVKPLLERKRRARINACLDELKDIMTVRKQIDSIAISLSVDIIVEFDKF